MDSISLLAIPGFALTLAAYPDMGHPPLSPPGRTHPRQGRPPLSAKAHLVKSSPKPRDRQAGDCRSDGRSKQFIHHPAIHRLRSTQPNQIDRPRDGLSIARRLRLVPRGCAKKWLLIGRADHLDNLTDTFLKVQNSNGRAST